MPVITRVAESKLVRWLKDNQKELKGKPSREIAELAYVDLGIRVSEATIKRINSQYEGIDVIRRREPNKSGDKYSKLEVVARSVMQLATALGVQLDLENELKQITHRKKWPVTENENGEVQGDGLEKGADNLDFGPRRQLHGII